MKPRRWSLARQLGSCGMTVALAPLAWLGACAAARALAQTGYEHQIVPWTRSYRVPTGEVPTGGRPVADPRVRAELAHYLRIWSLEPGASPDFPDAARFPWSFNPLHPSGQLLLLQQKQAYLRMKHVVRRSGDQWYLEPDPRSILGGRRFRLEARDGRLAGAWEL